MFIPLTLEEFVNRFLAAHPSWKKADLWFHAKKPRYFKREIEKKSYGRNILVDGDVAAPEIKMRTIHEPCSSLKVIQEYILHMILNPAADCLLPCVHGCVPGKSTVTNALPHVGAKLKIHMDLKDFFPSVTVQRIYGMFLKTFQYERKLAWLLSNLCSYEGRAPQGAPTSPMIANLIATPMDRRIVGLANVMAARYTRYVDDLTVSFHWRPPRKSVVRLMGAIRRIVEKYGFAINEDKTSVVTSKGRMVVTGVVVNTKTSIPIWFRKNLRAAIHQARLEIPGAETRNQILGKLAYIKGVCPEQAASLEKSTR